LALRCCLFIVAAAGFYFFKKSSLATSSSASAAQYPNIIFIIADDIAWNDYGSNSRILTPEIVGLDPL